MLELFIKENHKGQRKNIFYFNSIYFLYKRIFPHGEHDLGHALHVPAPGRVQYYRAEALPFVPDEIKTQLRFPKAYA